MSGQPVLAVDGLAYTYPGGGARAAGTAFHLALAAALLRRFRERVFA